MNLDLSSGGFAVLGAILGIWGLVGIVFYLWYLWALSKLFPYLGLPSSHGWIPFWNQWQLINRAGLPGWVVLLAIVPGLVVVGIIVSIMSVHRLNREFGKDASYTVLGAFLPPIWAMLLASHIADGVYAGASVYTGEAAFPPLSPTRSAPGWPEPVAPGAQPTSTSASLSASASARAPQARPAQPAAAAGAPGEAAMAPPNAGAAAPQPPSVDRDAPPAWQGLPPVLPGALPQSVPGAANEAGSAGAPETGYDPAPGNDADPGFLRDPHAMNDWGFSQTTEGNFERLAAEQIAARPAAPLGMRTAPEPFLWPGDVREPEATDGAPLAPAAPSVADVPVGVDGAGEPVAHVAPAEPATNEPATAVPATPLGAAEHARPAPSLDSAEDDLEDQTVLVSAPVRWALELPDGETHELLGDDVVVGRKPSPIDGSAVLTLADPTRTVSKSHVRLRFDGELWTVEDLNSTNGIASVGAAGELIPLTAGQVQVAPERLVLGTLEVTLRQL